VVANRCWYAHGHLHHRDGVVVDRGFRRTDVVDVIRTSVGSA
jgi:hypothetical protein